MKKLPARENPSVAVIGPGAIGSVLAAYMARSGCSVFLVGRDARWLSRARKKGIHLSGGKFGRGWRLDHNRVTPVIASTRDVRKSPRPNPLPQAGEGDKESLKSARPKCDVIFFCVKSGDILGAIRNARHWVGPNTVVVGLQNGLTHRPGMLSAFGKQRTVFGACYMAAERSEPARIHHHGSSLILLGKNRNNATAARQAQALLERAGFRAKIETPEGRPLWTKTVFNAATNPLGALTGRFNGELVGIAPLRELTLRALKEATAAARAAGHAVAYASLEGHLVAGLSATPKQPNSMLQDLRAGRPTEIDAIVKPLLQAARKKRLKTPILESLYRLTRRLDLELRTSRKISI